MYDVIIVGGNLVGASCALFLAKLRPDFNIGLIEAQEPIFMNDDSLDSRIYAVSPQNYRSLHELNAWPHAKYTSQITQMKIFGDLSGQIQLNAMKASRGYLAKVIESKRLLQSIYEQIKLLDNIEIIQTRLSSVEINTGITKLYTENNNVYECRLCIAADGANSFIRKQLNFNIQKIAYGQSAVVANFSCELPHNEIAYQWFLAGGDVLAYLPLVGKQISIVWSTNDPAALMRLGVDELCHKIALASEFKLGYLGLVTEPLVFPLGLTLVERSYTNGVVLIGDAAHTIHPLAGQGVNLGFADALLLADILSQYKAYQLGDVSILAKYDTQRLVKVREMQLVCHGLHGLFMMENQGIKLLRNQGMSILNNIQWIKNTLVRSAVNS